MLSLPRILAAAFSHPWVESYQIGFGPPLVRATTRLTEETRACKSALDKLDVYLKHCIMDAAECKRLAELQRRLLVRRMGPVEAESLIEASKNALDLRIRLKSPITARDEFRQSVLAMNVDVEALRSASMDAFAGHFLIRLDDPSNSRLLTLPEIGDPEASLALELRTPVECRNYWSAFLEALSFVAPFKPVSIGEPRAWAKVLRNGRPV